MSRAVRIALTICFLVTMLGPGGPAASASDSYRVAFAPSSPRLLARDPTGQYVGFEADFAAELARRLGAGFSYTTRPAAHLLRDGLRSSAFDLAIGGLAIADERDSGVAFSHPYLASGQAILVGVRERAPVMIMLKAVRDPMVIQALALFLAFVVLFAHLLWYMERRGQHAPESPYFPGIFGAAWYIFNIKTGIGLGDYMPRRWQSRLICVPAWIIGLLLIAVLTAHFITEFNRDGMVTSIQGKADLAGLRVATVGGTPSVAIVRGLAPRHMIATVDLADACDLLLDHRVDAVVFDYIALAAEFSRLQGHSPPVAMTGRLFNQQFYAVGISATLAQREPELIARMNRAIASMYGDGFLERTREKWLSDLKM